MVRIQKSVNRKQGTANVLIEVDARSFDCLMKLQRVNVGWNRCWVKEDINVNRCYNCSAYGHIASACKHPVCCPKCAGGHKANDCEADFEKCVNCDKANGQRKSPYDEILDINHMAWSVDCPLFKKRAYNAKQRIDYSI